MNQLNSHKIALLTQSIKAQNYLIKLTPFLVSLSLIPFIVSPSSLISFLHHFNFYFSTFSLQLFTHTIDKNCMFLLCNGLLVFVGITRSLSWSRNVDESYNYVKDDSKSLYSNVEANKESMLVVKEKTKHLEESEEVEDKVENINFKEGKGSSILDLEQDEGLEKESRIIDEGNEEKDKESEIAKRVEDEEVLVEANWVLSTEELNKKFDDFIRRMKEDLRIEAQKQLVMV